MVRRLTPGRALLDTVFPEPPLGCSSRTMTLSRGHSPSLRDRRSSPSWPEGSWAGTVRLLPRVVVKRGRHRADLVGMNRTEKDRSPSYPRALCLRLWHFSGLLPLRSASWRCQPLQLHERTLTSTRRLPRAGSLRLRLLALSAELQRWVLGYQPK